MTIGLAAAASGFAASSATAGETANAIASAAAAAKTSFLIIDNSPFALRIEDRREIAGVNMNLA